MKLSYNPQAIVKLFAAHGIPEPVFEYKFCPTRKWPFDLAWVDSKLALEVDGGNWVKGAHVRPARILKTQEKENTAAGMGWRILHCEPSALASQQTIDYIKAALCHANLI